LRYWVVPHTHWDREWYLQFEHFRFHLARTVDEILEVLEQDEAFRCFTLDGQAILLEDYLEARPENEGRLRDLIAGGRLAIGPWYTLPDEYLVGQESLVRNLLLGRAVCERFGRPMAVGYLVDTFGHVAQLPQILRGFGLDNHVFWRGLGDEGAEVGSAFRWQSPDGSQVLAIRILGGYGNAARLGDGEPDAATARVRDLTERYGTLYAKAGLSDFLLMNGTDHRPIQRGLPELLATCSRQSPESEFRIATIEEYVGEVRESVRALPTLEGELCGGHDIAVLRGVNSTRIGLKQANEAAERELFQAEALASLAAHAGARYPAQELRIAWWELLRNHPHDSICGCSIDAVHRDMEHRFATARAIARVVSRSSLAALAGHGPPWTPTPRPAEQRSVVNVLPWRRSGLVEVDLPPTLRRARQIGADSDDEPVAAQVEGGRGLVCVEVPGFGARQIRLRRGLGNAGAGARVTSERSIENTRYRVEAAADGTLTVSDLERGTSLAGLHVLEDCADRGDEYNFCPLDGDRGWTSAGSRSRVRVRRLGPVVAELEIELSAHLPARLRRDRRGRTRATVVCPVQTRVRLVAGVERVEITTVVDNRAEDHRLRVLFGVPGAEPRVRAEGHFAVIPRPAQPVWNGRWSEPPQTTHHTLGMVATPPLVLFTRGLPEYEAVPRAYGLDLALTLLRCVGWLSRNDLSNRFHHAGPALETPEAQCLGRHVFEYALSLDGDATDAELVRAAQDYRHTLVLGPAGAALPRRLRLEGEGFALAGLKQADDGDGLIARLYNPGAEPARVEVGGVLIRRCRLDETAVEDCGPAIELAPYEIVTLRLEDDRRSPAAGPTETS
jgi:alpha-mannosidase